MSAFPESYDEYRLACNEDILSRKYPDRRWRQVLWHIQKQSTPETRLSIRDPLVRQSYQAELLRRNPKTIRSNTGSVNAGILTALELGQSDTVLADLVRAYLLAGQTTAQVASLVGLCEDVICWFERLFFDVVRHLVACDWVQAYILVPADRAIDDYETGSPEYLLARDRAVLFDSAYRGGMKILMRIVPLAEELTAGMNPNLLNNSPTARILKWLRTSDASLADYVQLLDRVSTLLANEESLSDEELDNRLELVAKYIEHGESKRSGQKKHSHRNVESTEAVGGETTFDRSSGSVPEESGVTELPESSCSKSAVA